MIRLEQTKHATSIYDLENPNRHRPVREILEEAGAEIIHDDLKSVHHGNGYTTLVPRTEND